MAQNGGEWGARVASLMLCSLPYMRLICNMGIGLRDNEFCGSRYMASSFLFKQQVPSAWVDCGRVLHATMCCAAIAVESLECF